MKFLAAIVAAHLAGCTSPPLRDLGALWRDKVITEEECQARRHVLLQAL